MIAAMMKDSFHGLHVIFNLASEVEWVAGYGRKVQEQANKGWKSHCGSGSVHTEGQPVNRLNAITSRGSLEAEDSAGT